MELQILIQHDDLTSQLAIAVSFAAAGAAGVLGLLSKQLGNLKTRRRLIGSLVGSSSFEAWKSKSNPSTFSVVHQPSTRRMLPRKGHVREGYLKDFHGFEPNGR